MLANYVLRSKTSIGSAKEAFLVMSSLKNIASSKILTVAKADLVSGRSLSEARPNVKVSLKAYPENTCRLFQLTRKYLET